LVRIEIASTRFLRHRIPGGRNAFRVATLALAFATVLLCPLRAGAKEKPPTTKTVSGKVLDAQDNGIANAVVSLTDLTSKKKVAIYSGKDGSYQFSGLSFTDDYELRATYNGKSSDDRKVSSWDTRDRLVMYLHIPPPADQ
jgi:hypothetical protein